MQRCAGKAIHECTDVQDEPLPAPEPIAGFTLDENKKLLRDCTTGVLELGEHLLHEGNLGVPSAQKFRKLEPNVGTTTDEWVTRLGPLREGDASLFNILHDSLRDHTPLHIFNRWNALNDELQSEGRTLTCLLTEAVRNPQREQSSLCSKLYVLLLDHCEALIQYVDTTILDSADLSCHLSATCVALHIRFYLPRFHGANSLWTRLNDRIHKRFKNFVSFTFQGQLLSMFVVREIQHLRDNGTDFLDDVKRELISDPVRVDDIAERLTGSENVFCSICQEDHVHSQCVSPLKCSCIFGCSCLETLLNRDSESSNTCPNCRAQLHEPLQWRVVTEDMNDEVLEMGILGAQFASIFELADEMDVHNLRHSVRERIVASLAPGRERDVLR